MVAQRRSPIPARGIALLLGMFPITACEAGGAGGSEGERLVRSDSAGIQLIVNRSPAWQAGSEWTVDSNPALQIGKVEGSEDEMLYGVVSVRFADDAVLVAQQTELRVYDERGSIIRTLGGTGPGPGEFERLAGAIACGDTVYATELFPARLSWFDATGNPGTLLLPPPERQGILNPLSPLLTCGYGGVIGLMSGRLEVQEGPPSVIRPPKMVVRVQPRERQVDTLMTFPGTEVFDGLTVPFGRQTLIAATPDGIYVVDTGQPELRILGVDGRLRRIVRLSRPATKVAQEDVESIQDQYLNADEGGLPSELEAEVRTRLDAVPFPQTMPYFSAMHVSPNGTVWLRDYQPFRKREVTGWTVVSPSGEWMGPVEFPSAYQVHDMGDAGTIGVWRDEFDVEHVRFYRFRR